MMGDPCVCAHLGAVVPLRNVITVVRGTENHLALPPLLAPSRSEGKVGKEPQTVSGKTSPTPQGSAPMEAT